MGRRKLPAKICCVDGCGKSSKRQSYCGMHWSRLQRHGDLEANPSKNGLPLQFLMDHRNYDGKDCVYFPFGAAGKKYKNGIEVRAIIRIDGKNYTASRFMTMLVYGNPPPDQPYDAAHSCGNGHLNCINPNHLSWKTKQQNSDDMITHGTRLYGEKCKSSKLKTEDVVAIRLAFSEGKRVSDIRREYGMSHGGIKKIVTRETWKDVI